MQNCMFMCFFIIMIFVIVFNVVLLKFYINCMFWEVCEYLLCIYGWVVFCIVEVLFEILGSILVVVLYFLLWYFFIGLLIEVLVVGYVFLMMLFFFLFMVSWGQWICVWVFNFIVISNILLFFLVIFFIFNGVVVFYDQLNVFWRYWIYYVNLLMWWVRGVFVVMLNGQSVQCVFNEVVYFDFLLGQMCLEFVGDFVRQVGQGYLFNFNDMVDCGFCLYLSGNQYLNMLGIILDEKWRDFGIFLVFCFINWM